MSINTFQLQMNMCLLQINSHGCGFAEIWSHLWGNFEYLNIKFANFISFPFCLNILGDVQKALFG